MMPALDFSVLSPLSLNPLTRDSWGQFDATAIAQLAPLANEECFQLKFYKAPADGQEVLAGNAYAAYGMRVTPGSIIFGFYLPMVGVPGAPLSSLPAAFVVQIRDVSLQHNWFDDPISSLFLSNYKPTYQSESSGDQCSFPNLLTAPYPVTGTGLFRVEVWSTSVETQRIELIFGVLEVCK